jgi:F-type H+-transporting ATPase subunit delta
MATGELKPGPNDTVMDVTEEQVARVYAKAYLGAANNSPNVAGLVDEIESLVNDVLAKFPTLDQVLRSSLVSQEDKEQVLDRVFASRASTTLLHFLKVLARHGRLQLLRSIARSVRKLYGEQLGQTEVQIRVAAPLSDALRQEIMTMAEQALKTVPMLQVTVDRSLVAGIVVRIGDRVFDGSIATRLKELRKTIVSRTIENIETRPEKFLL